VLPLVEVGVSSWPLPQNYLLPYPPSPVFFISRGYLTPCFPSIPRCAMPSTGAANFFPPHRNLRQSIFERFTHACFRFMPRCRNDAPRVPSVFPNSTPFPFSNFTTVYLLLKKERGFFFCSPGGWSPFPHQAPQVFSLTQLPLFLSRCRSSMKGLLALIRQTNSLVCSD